MNTSTTAFDASVLVTPRSLQAVAGRALPAGTPAAPASAVAAH